MKKIWQDGYQNISYNNWLREEAQEQSSTLLKNMARLLDQLQVSESVILQAGITLERYERVSQAVNHLKTELHLLVTIQENK